MNDKRKILTAMLLASPAMIARSLPALKVDRPEPREPVRKVRKAANRK